MKVERFMATKEELERFFKKEFPQADFEIDSVSNKSAIIRKKLIIVICDRVAQYLALYLWR